MAVPAQPPQVRLTRRQLLGAAAVMLPPLALGAAVGASLWQLGRFRIRRIRVPVPDLPDALDGLTIAHVTDTHISRFLQMDDLPEIIAGTNALGADLIVLTGDLIDSGFGDLPALTAELKKMRPGVPGGLAMCVGNHDVMRTELTSCAKSRPPASRCWWTRPGACASAGPASSSWA